MTRFEPVTIAEGIVAELPIPAGDRTAATLEITLSLIQAYKDGKKHARVKRKRREERAHG